MRRASGERHFVLRRRLQLGRGCRDNSGWQTFTQMKTNEVVDLCRNPGSNHCRRPTHRLFCGLENSIARMREQMDAAR